MQMMRVPGRIVWRWSKVGRKVGAWKKRWDILMGFSWLGGKVFWMGVDPWWFHGSWSIVINYCRISPHGMKELSNLGWRIGWSFLQLGFIPLDVCVSVQVNELLGGLLHVGATGCFCSLEDRTMSQAQAAPGIMYVLVVLSNILGTVHSVCFIMAWYYSEYS